MKKFLKIFFRSGLYINDPQSNFLQAIIITPIIMVLVFIAMRYGLEYFVVGIAVLGFLLMIGWILFHK